MVVQIALTALVIALCALALRFLAWFAWRGSRRLARAARPPLRAARKWSGRLSPIQAIHERWPGTVRWLANRFQPERFDGLPLTLIVAVLVYVVFLLAGLVEEAFESEELLAIDQQLMALVEPLRTDAVVETFVWITGFGNLETLIAITLVATAMLAVHGPRRFILPLWISVLGAQVTSWSGKYVVARPRPDFLVDVGVNSPSFPSGHATGATSVYLLIAYILARDLKSESQSFEVVYWSAAVALLVAFSRVMIGVHYPSDIAAGVLLGGFWMAVAIVVAELIKQRRERHG